MLQREVWQLNQTAEEELSSANQTQQLEEVKSMLATVRRVDLTAAKAAATQELRCVSHVSFFTFFFYWCLTPRPARQAFGVSQPGGLPV